MFHHLGKLVSKIDARPLQKNISLKIELYILHLDLQPHVSLIFEFPSNYNVVSHHFRHLLHQDYNHHSNASFTPNVKSSKNDQFRHVNPNLRSSQCIPKDVLIYPHTGLLLALLNFFFIKL